MYNSVIVRFLVKVWDTLVFYYEESLVKKIGGSIRSLISRLGEGSVLKSIFTSDSDLMENTLFYRVYTSIVDWINRVLTKINQAIKKLQKTSVVSDSLNNLFKDYLEIIKTFSIFIMFFGLGIILNSFIRGMGMSFSVVASIVLILISILVLSLGERVLDILENSWTIGFLVNLFRVEEGGDQWW